MLRRELGGLPTSTRTSSYSSTTATGLSRMLNNTVSHDKITRFLSKREYSSKDLWQQVKTTIRQVESGNGVISIDDTIEEKPYTDENEIICWHYDHSAGKSVKGVNILSCIYTNDTANIPLAFEIVKKDQIVTDEKTGKQRRKSPVTKNEFMRKMIKTCVHNQVKFKYVLADIWFSAKANMAFIKKELSKDFIFAIKGNRTAALSKEDKLKGNF